MNKVKYSLSFISVKSSIFLVDQDAIVLCVVEDGFFALNNDRNKST